MWQQALILVGVQLLLVLLVAVLPDRLPAALMLMPHLRPGDGASSRRSPPKRSPARRKKPKRTSRPVTKSKRKPKRKKK